MWGPFRVACCRYTWGFPAICHVMIFSCPLVSLWVIVYHIEIWEFQSPRSPRSCLDWGSTGAAAATSSRLAEICCRAGRWIAFPHKRYKPQQSSSRIQKYLALYYILYIYWINLNYIISNFIISNYVIIRSNLIYCIWLYYILYYIIFHYILLYHIILYYITLFYHIILDLIILVLFNCFII
jgi:hypothetical protein